MGRQILARRNGPCGRSGAQVYRFLGPYSREYPRLSLRAPFYDRKHQRYSEAARLGKGSCKGRSVLHPRKGIGRFELGCGQAGLARISRSLIKTRTLHKNREGMRHPSSEEPLPSIVAFWVSHPCVVSKAVLLIEARWLHQRHFTRV